MNTQWKLVPVEPTETMVINGFESEPDECFTDDEVWEQCQEMSGCQQAAFRAKLCWAAMLASAPEPPRADAGEIARLNAERDALQLRLNAADQRIDELTAQQAESRMITLSGCEFSEHELLRTAVRMVTGTSRRGTQRWVAMKDAFCCGSGVAHALCRRFGFDPDETVKP